MQQSIFRYVFNILLFKLEIITRDIVRKICLGPSYPAFHITAHVGLPPPLLASTVLVDLSSSNPAATEIHVFRDDNFPTYDAHISVRWDYQNLLEGSNSAIIVNQLKSYSECMDEISEKHVSYIPCDISGAAHKNMYDFFNSNVLYANFKTAFVFTIMFRLRYMTISSV
uniref:Uncharacterized protein n=1 Tax=Glossina austeni TaxID=7395 RepID=A0A1A9VLK9_GLOAU